MRIIAGSARGRRFDAPEGRNTRPTLDRVKEAMFGMIQFDIENTQVLDLFSGSGSLGLEALSRGGAHCVFCDSDKKSIQVIKRNVEALGFGGRSEVLFGDAFVLLPLLSAEKRRFSLVLLDPPYESDFYSRAVNELVRLNLLEDGCIILAEHAFKRPPQFNCPNISCGKTVMRQLQKSSIRNKGRNNRERCCFCGHIRPVHRRAPRYCSPCKHPF